MTTEEQIKALQAEVDGLRLAFAQYHTQVAEWRDRMQQVSDKMVEVSSESTQRFIEPAIKHQLMCGLLASRKGVILSEEANTYWWQVSAIYKAGVERGIYPREQP